MACFLWMATFVQNFRIAEKSKKFFFYFTRIFLDFFTITIFIKAHNGGHNARRHYNFPRLCLNIEGNFPKCTSPIIPPQIFRNHGQTSPTAASNPSLSSPWFHLTASKISLPFTTSILLLWANNLPEGCFRKSKINHSLSDARRRGHRFHKSCPPGDTFRKGNPFSF